MTQAGTEPLFPSDLYRFALAADPQLAPDGSTVIYRRTAFDHERDSTGGALRRVRPDRPPEPLTSGRNDRMPRISPDGSQLAFVRDVDDKPVIFVLPLDGGEARAVGGERKGLSSLAWSPDGAQLAFTAAAPFDAATAHVFFDEPSGARHIRALPYKGDAEGLHDGRRSQLFVIGSGGENERQITRGDHDIATPAWSPDGRTIAATLGGTREASMLSDIVLIDVAAGTLRALTAGDGPHGLPAFSPDGMRVAWIGHRRGNDSRYLGELYVAALDGTHCRSLSAALDRPVGDYVGGDLRSGTSVAPAWIDAQHVAVQVTDRGNTSLYAFDADSGASTVLAGGERHIYAFSCAGGRIAFAYATSTVPSEIALSGPDEETVLTDDNPWLATKRIAEPRSMQVPAADGTPLDLWILAPESNAAGSPAVLEIHGGPHASYGNTFFLEFQILAGCGLTVIYGNPRGSAGYGAAFTSAISGDWGGIDAADILSILEGGLHASGLDGTRVAVAGGSYGGLMTTWLLGHSDRFVTGISMRAVNDYVSFLGATDIGFFLKAELGLGIDEPDVRALYERSPIRAAHAINVPLLIMHSERDYRCPIDQAEQLFNRLRMLGKNDVEFVRFTGDGHELSRGGKPRHRALRLRAIAHWLVRHLTPAGPEAGAAGDLFRPLAGEPAEETPVAVH